jgi:hypothetical protein
VEGAHVPETAIREARVGMETAVRKEEMR